MSRRQKDPLRCVTTAERRLLERLSRAPSQPAAHVARAQARLAVADGCSYSEAARIAGYHVGDTVAQLVSRFNGEGLGALEPRHGGGTPASYGVAETERIGAEVRRLPARTSAGTATWSRALLKRRLRQAPDGLPHVSTYPIQRVLHEAGDSWQKDRSWCQTGQVTRTRKAGTVTVTDPDAVAKKTCVSAPSAVAKGWHADEAGPFQTVPSAGTRWQPEGHPVRQPHAYERNGTAKLLTLFHSSSGHVRVKGVTSSAKALVHPWLQEHLSAMMATLPEPAAHLSPQANRAIWERGREGLTGRVTLPTQVPPGRMLLLWDNLTAHKTPELLLWMVARGILPVQTPVGGSWLTMAESMQRMLKRRAGEGHQPTQPSQMIAWLEEPAQGWNRDPTPFAWGGKRAVRRKRARERRQALGGSGAYTRRPLRVRQTALSQWQRARQTTH